MPQLDFLIVASQTYLIPIFIFSFLIFICYVLPWIALYIKLDTKMVNNKYNNITITSNYYKEYSELHELNYELLLKISKFYKFYRTYKKEIAIQIPIANS